MTHGGVLPLVTLQAEANNTPPWMFSRFLNCTKRTKLRKASHVIAHLHIRNVLKCQ